MSSIRYTIHHCELILSYWCRLLNLDITISSIDSIICQTIISYRGPGDIIAFSSNGTLSTIEIYNHTISKQFAEIDINLDNISNKLRITPVHTNMHFKSSNTNSKPCSFNTWHPTLCSTLDYQYIYSIGGCDPLKGLFGESTNTVNIFDIYNMNTISLPPMKLNRAKCSANILPPFIPYHDYKDIDNMSDISMGNLCAPNIMELFKNLKSPRVPPPPIPPMLHSINKIVPKSPPPNKPIPPLPTAPFAPPLAPLAPPIAPLPNGAIIAPPNNSNQSGSPPPLFIRPSLSSLSLTPPSGSPKEKNIQRKFYTTDINNRLNNGLPDYCVFVSGGINGNKLHKKCEIFYPYETDSGKWNEIMSMKQGRCGHISVYMGASQWKYSLNNSWSCENRMDMLFNEWKDISCLTTKIFVCGGKREHGNGITSCETFDLEKNKWIMCQRAPFTNHGYQSGCWLTSKESIAMISHPMDGNKVAIYKPEINKWNIIGDFMSNTQTQMNYLKPNNMNNNKPRNKYNLIHFYPLIGTLWLFNQEYLYIMGDDYKCKSLEIYDERLNKWIAIGIKYNVNKIDSSIQEKCDQLLQLTKYKQFDAFHSIS